MADGVYKSISFTRPNDATPYNAGDVVGAAAAALNCGPFGDSNGETLITGVSLRIDVNALPAGMTGWALHLYNVTPPSALADNAVFDLPSGDRAAYLGAIQLPTPTDLGATLWAEINSVNKQVHLLSTAALYGYLQTIGAFTPAALTVFTLQLQGVRL